MKRRGREKNKTQQPPLLLAHAKRSTALKERENNTINQRVP